MNTPHLLILAVVACAWTTASHPCAAAIASEAAPSPAREAVQFDLRSVRDGHWSDAKTWSQPRVPKAGDRVLVSRGTRVVYDGESKDVVRLIQVVGTLA